MFSCNYMLPRTHSYSQARSCQLPVRLWYSCSCHLPDSKGTFFPSAKVQAPRNSSLTQKILQWLSHKFYDPDHELSCIYIIYNPKLQSCRHFLTSCSVSFYIIWRHGPDGAAWIAYEKVRTVAVAIGGANNLWLSEWKNLKRKILGENWGNKWIDVGNKPIIHLH